MTQTFVVFFDGGLFVVIRNVPQLWLRNMVLDWYAEKYAIDREKITGEWSQEIDASLATFAAKKGARP